MIFSRSQQYLLFSGVLIIILLSWVLQSTFLLKSDDLWQMNLAQYVLNGKHYGNDFIEINPPLSIFMYMPAVIISKFFLISRIVSFKIVMTCYALISIALCFYFLMKIFRSEDRIMAFFLILLLPFIFLILPLYEFGQRENLLVIFAMPYFLLVVCRLQNSSINLNLQLFSGVMAALGFALKPFFLIAFVLVECYTVFNLYKVDEEKKGRLLRAIFRAETICIVFFIFFYGLAIYVFFEQYLYVVVPIAAHFYYQSLAEPWTSLIFDYVFCFCLLIMGFQFIHYKKNNHKALIKILTLTLIGFLMSYLIQRMRWYYHFLPAFSIALFLFTFQMMHWFSVLSKNKKSILIACVVCQAILLLPNALVFLTTRMAEQIKLDAYSVISYLHLNAFHKPVYFISSAQTGLISDFEEADAYFSGSIEVDFWMRDFYKKNFFQNMTLQQKKDSDFLSEMVARDIDQQKPLLVLVDKYCIVDNVHFGPFDPLYFLNKNKAFYLAWHSYRYLTTLKKDNVYDYDVYARANGKLTTS